MEIEFNKDIILKASVIRESNAPLDRFASTIAVVFNLAFNPTSEQMATEMVRIADTHDVAVHAVIPTGAALSVPTSSTIEMVTCKIDEYIAGRVHATDWFKAMILGVFVERQTNLQTSLSSLIGDAS